MLKGLAAVDGAEDATLVVRTVGMAEHGHEQAVGIFGIDEDGRDLLAVAQTEMLPRLAAVGRFVHAVADGKIGPLQTFAAADIDDVGIGGRDGERADGSVG